MEADGWHVNRDTARDRERERGERAAVFNTSGLSYLVARWLKMKIKSYHRAAGVEIIVHVVHDGQRWELEQGGLICSQGSKQNTLGD